MKKIFTFGVLLTLASSAFASAQAAQCDKLNIEGKYRTQWGDNLRIVQNGCKSARLIDLDHKISYDFVLDGKTTSTLPKKFMTVQKTRGNEFLNAGVYTSAIEEDGYSNGFPHVKMQLLADVAIPSLTGKKHRLGLIADGYLYVSYNSSQAKGIYPAGIHFSMDNFRLADVKDSTESSPIKQAFIKGANTILSFAEGRAHLRMYEFLERVSD